MCITACSSIYLKRTSEETSAENSELVIKSLDGQVYSPETFNETLGAFTMPDFFALAVYYEACYVVVQCNTPGLLTSNMLNKIYDHE